MTHVYMNIIRLIASFCLLVLVTSSTSADTKGNLKGKITDLSSGQPLPLVNVYVVGSGRGAVTNDKGEYSITGIPGGTYTLRVSLIGYQTIEMPKLVIDANETSVYDFKLASEDVQLEGVTVEGQRPLVDVTKTAGDQTFNRDKIDQLPNVKGVEDVLGVQAGIVKFGQQLFLRGGRANETQILIDGVVVNDVGGVSGTAGTSTANEQLQQLYSGTATGGTGGALSVSANAIQSVSVSSSGLDVEFGNAQSGVVNITTRSGGETYSASGQFRRDGVVGPSFNDRYYSANIGGPEPISKYVLPALGIELPGKLSFFMSSSFNQSDGPHGYLTDRFYNPIQRKIRFGGIFGSILDHAGFTYTDRQQNDFSFNTKLSYAAGERDQFSFSYRANASTGHPLQGGYSSLGLYDSSSAQSSIKTQNVLQWQHILGTNSLIKGYISRLSSDRTNSVGTLTPAQYSSMVDLSLRDPNHDGFNDIGTSQGWSRSREEVWNAKFDLNSQVHRWHFLKVGTEFYAEHVRSTAISYPLYSVRDTNSLGEYPGYGRARWVTDNTPKRGAIYAQDNIEFTGINIHVGVRYDYLYLGEEVSRPAFVKRYEAVTNSNSTTALVGDTVYADWVDYNSDHSSFTARSFWHALTHGNFSPRLSIGYPVSVRTVFYFNYSHFLQYPERDQYFRYPVSTTLSNYVGNPSLKPQRTVQYESGFDQLIFDDLSLGIRGFYKDIFDYATLRDLPTVDPPIKKWVNLDYASARGFEIILTKQLTNRYSGSIGYTFQLAKGRSSNPFEVIANPSPSLAGLPREVRLDWDQQHTLNIFAAYRVGVDDDFRAFGLPLNNWGASVTFNFGSGFPYTPYLNKTATLSDAYLKNTGDGPYSSEVNLSLFKGFSLMNKLNVLFSLDVTNLFNRRNVDALSTSEGFNTLTGRPIAYGDYNPSNGVLYTWGGKSGEESFAARVPPFVFRAPRQISLGMKINWD
jgi:hypothetical protein